MNIKKGIQNFGWAMFGIAIVLALIAVGTILIRGAVWASITLLPWLSLLTEISLGLIVIVFLPLAIHRKTRAISSTALFISSYIFGATLWITSFLLTLLIWGGSVVLFGLLMAGIGIIPIAFLATITQGRWETLGLLAILGIMTMGTSYGAAYLAESLEAGHNKGIFSRLLLGRKIRAILRALKDADFEFNNFFHFDDVRNLAKKIILENKKDIIRTMREQNMSPRRVAYAWINNVSGDFLESGRYHIYRGILNPLGEEYLKIFDKSTELLCLAGDMNEEQVEQHKQDIRDRIQEVG